MITVRPMAPERIPWIAERARLNIGPGFIAIEAVIGDRTVGAIGFDGWTPASVSMHIALDSPIAFRALLRQAFHQVFVEWDRRVATCLILENNTRSRALVDSVGFREAFVGKDYWAPGVGMVLYEMRREDCIWLADKPPRIRGSARRRKARTSMSENRTA